MTQQHHSAKMEGKQFRLVKFFAYASFIVLVLFSFPFSVVISQKAKDILMKSYENYALLLGENLNYQVFRNFVIPVMRRYGEIRLRETEQHELMDKIVKNTIHSFNVDVVNVYDISNGIIAYSTDPTLIQQKVKESLGYRKAVKGEQSSGLISRGDELWGLGIDKIGGERKLRTFIPFRGEDRFAGTSGYVLGVFELLQDLTPQYESIVRFQYLVFSLSILIMGLIFLALLLIVHKAEKIIEERAKGEKELEEQLNLAERLAALGEMVAGVSHEIKNPLGIIQSTAELLGGMPDANETQKRLSGVITEESGRLNGIVTEFLDFARPQVPNVGDCRLEEIIEKTLSFLGPELEKRGIVVNNDLNGKPFELAADQELIYQALLNVLINAIQSMEEGGGTLAIGVKEERDNYRIEIRDSGCGIGDEHIKKIFNPFFTTKAKGSGLGLSIVRKIIEGHQGKIAIESQEGLGTKVEVLLPRK